MVLMLELWAAQSPVPSDPGSTEHELSLGSEFSGKLSWVIVFHYPGLLDTIQMTSSLVWKAP